MLQADYRLRTLIMAVTAGHIIITNNTEGRPCCRIIAKKRKGNSRGGAAKRAKEIVRRISRYGCVVFS